MTEEWFVFRFTNGLLYCASKWWWEKNYSTSVEGVEVIATELTQEQARAMVKLSRSKE